MNVLPNNVEAETNVLGSIIVDNSLSYKLEKLAKDDFYNEKLKILFFAMLDLHKQKKPIDPVSLVEKGVDPVEVVEITGHISTTKNINYFINVLKDNTTKRKLIQTAEKIIKEVGNNEVEDLRDYSFRASTFIESLGSREEKTLVKLSDLVKQNIEETKLKAKGKVEKGTYTGYLNLDVLTRGIEKTDFVIIAARPSVGKTAFALNLAMKVARANNANVLVFSLEMKAKQLAYRIMSNLARIPAGEIKNGSIVRTKEKELERLEELSKMYDVYIDDSFTNKVADIKDKVIQFKRNNKVAMVIIDYIQLLQPSRFSNKYEATSEISRDLKRLAYELEIPVMALSQLNRNVEQNKKDSEPKMSDLRDSGSLEQDADMIMLMSRSDYQNDDKSKTSNVRVRVAKCRNGSTGNADFWYYRDNSLFVEQDERRE